jgi:hypothetical protein
MPVEPNYANGTRPTEENYANGTRPTEENYDNGTSPVAPVTPEGGIYAGGLDGTFSGMQQKVGALHASNGDIVGVMLVKVGKANSRGFVTFNAKATFVGGKSVSARATASVAGYSSGSQSVQCELAFREPIGTMYLESGTDGRFRLSNSKYFMRAATVGGDLGGGNTKATFSLSGDVGGIVPGDVIREYLPNNVKFDVSGGKWNFAKAGTVKLATNRETGAYELSVNGENVSGLKLAYTAKTGGFKGRFKVYSLETSAGKTRLKKTSLSVVGFVIDGVGHGQATVKSSSGTALVVTIQ